MSKGNLFLGMGRGSVGDVTLYRANGQQLARARNRSPRNPKTDAQIVQRAISATVVQMYKMGKSIFDHSFEGRSVPSGCQRRFLSLNMRILREQIVSEMNSSPADCYAAVVSPRSTRPVPNKYRISEGSLTQNLFVLSVQSSESIKGPYATMVAAETGETVAQYAARLGLVAGEIYTIVGVGIGNQSTSNDVASPSCGFGFVRLIVKDDVATSSTLMSAATYGDFFTVDEEGASLPTDQLVTVGISIFQCVESVYSYRGSMGVIRSRENSSLRSTSDMMTMRDIDNTMENAYGVKAPKLLDSWREDTSTVQSALILEGGGF